jgi:hypothetical protein
MSTFHSQRIAALGFVLGACLYLGMTATPSRALPVVIGSVASTPTLDRESVGVPFETATLACG